MSRTLAIRLPFLVISVVVVIALFGLRTTHLMPDAVQYCLDAKRGLDLFHPHHLAYTAMIFVVRAALSKCGIDVDCVTAAQVHNLVFTTLLIGVFGRWIAARDCSDRVPRYRVLSVEIVALLLLLSTSAILEFSTQPEPYLPSLACAVGTFRALASPGEKVRVRNAIVAAAFLCCAILYHQIAVLFVIPLLISAVWTPASLRKFAVVECALAIAIGGLSTLVAYVAAFIGSDAPESFLGFCTRYLHTGQSNWGTTTNLGGKGLVTLGSSLARSIVDFDSVGLSLATSLLLPALLIWHVVVAVRGPEERTLRVTCIGWISILTTFLLWWLPSQTKYLIFVLPPIAALVALALRDALGEKIGCTAGIVLAAGLLFKTSGVTLIPHHFDPDAIRTRAASLHELGDATLIRICNTETANFLRYDFDDTSVIPVAIPLASAATGTLRVFLSQMRDPLEGAERIVIPLGELKPSVAVTTVAGLQDSGFRFWFEFVDWLFGVREDGGVRTRRGLSAIRMSNGEVAIVISNERVPSASMDELLTALDSAVASLEDSRWPAPNFEFMTWSRSSAVMPR